MCPTQQKACSTIRCKNLSTNGMNLKKAMENLWTTTHG